jgi:hypothetical protein
LAVGSYFDLVGSSTITAAESSQQQQQSNDMLTDDDAPVEQFSSSSVPATTSSYRMRHAFGIPISESEVLTLPVQFQNIGETPWPHGTHLRFLSGNKNIVVLCDSPAAKKNNYSTTNSVQVGALMVSISLLTVINGQLRLTRYYSSRWSALRFV